MISNILQEVPTSFADQRKFKIAVYSKACLKWPLKNRQNKDINDKWYLNEGRKYCRMLPLEHSAILLTCIKP